MSELARCLAEDVPPLPADPDLDTIAAAVSDLRQLPWSRPPEVLFLTPEELATEVRRAVQEEHLVAQVATEARILRLLGAIPWDLDLRATVEAMYTTQVAAFYDPERDLLVVPGTPEALTPSQRLAIVHELAHALVDQHIELPAELGDDDADLALLAVIEGDATLVEGRYGLAALTLLEQLGTAADPAVGTAVAQLEQLPYHLIRRLVFPYVEGLSYICRTFLDGGWRAVDRRYVAPPTTTREVLGGGPVPARDLRDPPPPGPGWQQVSARRLGAAELLWLFEAPGGDPAAGPPDAQRWALRWLGGEVHLWEDGADDALGVVLEGEDAGLCWAVVRWATAAYPGALPTSAPAGAVLALDGTVDVVVACRGREVGVGIAADRTAAARLAGSEGAPPWVPPTGFEPVSPP